MALYLGSLPSSMLVHQGDHAIPLFNYYHFSISNYHQLLHPQIGRGLAFAASRKCGGNPSSGSTKKPRIISSIQEFVYEPASSERAREFRWNDAGKAMQVKIAL